MFQDVKQLKIKEAEATIAQLNAKKVAMYDDVKTLKDKLWDLEVRLKELKTDDQYGVGNFAAKKYSMLKRTFSTLARRTYRDYQANLAEMRALPERIAALSSEIEIAEVQAAGEVARSGILQAVEKAEHTLWQVEQATTLAQLNVSPDDAVQMLTANDVTPVLDESDYEIFERPRNFQSRADLIAVHKMDIMPTNNRLTTLSEAGVKQTEKVTIDGQEYEFSYLLERNTMHFSMNDEVSSHFYGDWENCHYLVLQPFAEIPHDKIGAMMANDTFTRGGVDLTENAWIICPKDEVQTVQELNPHVHVLGYQGENVKGLAAPFLSQLGYRAEKVGQWGWYDEQSRQQFEAIIDHEKLHAVQHTNSTDYEDEEFNIYANRAIAMIKMLVEQNLVRSVEDFERIKPQLAKVMGIGNLIRHTDVQEINIDDTAIVANGRQIQVFAEKMEKAGMPVTNPEYVRLRDHMAGYQWVNDGLNTKDLLINTLVNSALRARTMTAERTL